MTNLEPGPDRLACLRHARTAALSVAVLCGAALSAGSAATQGRAPTVHSPPKPYEHPAAAPVAHEIPNTMRAGQAWAARCVSSARNAEPDCSVEQRVLLKQNGQLLVAVIVSLSHDANTPTILIQVPLGLALEKGVTLKLNNRGPVTLHLQTCDQSGCYAATGMSKDFLDGMMTGKTMEVRVSASTNQSVIKVPMPLDGFADAYARIK